MNLSPVFKTWIAFAITVATLVLPKLMALEPTWTWITTLVGILSALGATLGTSPGTAAKLAEARRQGAAMALSSAAEKRPL